MGTGDDRDADSSRSMAWAIDCSGRENGCAVAPGYDYGYAQPYYPDYGYAYGARTYAPYAPGTRKHGRDLGAAGVAPAATTAARAATGAAMVA